VLLAASVLALGWIDYASAGTGAWLLSLVRFQRR